VTKALGEKIRSVPEEVKEAVREKWLSYCKCQHINQVMVWRQKLMKQEMGE